MTENRAHVQIFSTRIPVDGWGSFAIVGLAAAIATAFPEARLITFAGLLGGSVLAALLIKIRQG